MSFIVVRHNIEVAHRLFELEGDKCQNIHGHSMWVEMKLHGHINKHGLLEGLNFGDVKKEFRGFLDKNYDHHLLLNENDPWAQDLDPEQRYDGSTKPILLPGLMATPGDPSTENIAKWIATWAVATFKLKVDVAVQETHVNGAGFSEKP
jgi:6-pyruvoyl-tetrahydropterin synthase